ncbi:HAD-IA family hydrolase [uncultured Neptuniibacter sp.]|uniref:HAD-IA family hydrolase n=1 Tax=uncultured Neptuniibacter sp. TaxID=502143 RepID=UPI0026271BF1|nr:HAD-IA family hydrolase [uncultured Neptuniibacter sp.]
MHAKPASVLFDLDGTLIDTAPDFHWVINQLLQEEGRTRIDFDFLRRYVSNGARAMIAAAFDLEEDDSDFPRLHQRMLEIYLEHLAVDSSLFPGLQDCLHWLQQHEIPWGVVTNKPERFTLPVMQGLAIDEQASSIICPDHVTHKKPHPESLLLACQQINCSPENSIYVGDHLRDIEAGKRAGMITIAATYGYIDEDEDPQTWDADHYISCATELKPLLKSLYSVLTP